VPVGFEVMSNAAVSKGSEVFTSYGAKSAGELLLSYGFVPQRPESQEYVGIRLVRGVRRLALRSMLAHCIVTDWLLDHDDDRVANQFSVPGCSPAPVRYTPHSLCLSVSLYCYRIGLDCSYSQAHHSAAI